MKRAALVGLVLVATAVVAGALLAPRILLAGWLAAWWWALGLMLGAFVNGWMSRLTGGRWGEPVQAAALAGRQALPWLLLALVPLALAHRWLYPWADPASGWLRDIARPGFLRAWLSPGFFIARLVVYAVAWWWITQPASLLHKARAAASLIVHVLLTSLAAVDLLMSLVPGWFSTAFGLVVLSAQALSGAALAVLWTHGAPGEATHRPVEADVPVSRDLGNLLLMWVMSWAYLAFMQFLIIWSENLPREIAWYVPRLQTGWAGVGLALVIVQLVLPFLALLMRGIKDQPRRLVRVAMLLLAATALDTAWTVLPSVDPHTLHGWWLFPLLFAGAALLMLVPATKSCAAHAPAEGELQHAG
jgi:hypothetical protein